MNQLATNAPVLNISPDTEPADTDLIELVFQFNISVNSSPSDVLLKPIKALMEQPESIIVSTSLSCQTVLNFICCFNCSLYYCNHCVFCCQGSFLPTMPEDNLAEIQAALLAGRNGRGGDHNPVLFREYDIEALYECMPYRGEALFRIL